MRNSAAIFLILVVVIPLGATHKIEDDCEYWQQMATSLSNVHQAPMPFGTKIYMHCHAGCANITCSGNFNMSGVFGTGGLDMDFCFGIQQNPCASPLAIQYYMDLPKQNISQSGNLTHSSDYEIPVPSSIANITVILAVEMVKFNQSAITFKMTSKVRIMEGNMPLFPYQRPIFPETTIDVPECPKDQSELQKFQVPKTCKSLPAPTQTSTKAPAVIKSKTYHKSCELDLDQCLGRNEMCVARGGNTISMNGVCQCIQDAFLSFTTGYCELTNPVTAIHTTEPVKSSTQMPSGSQNSTGGKRKNLVPLIIGSVVGVVALIVVGIVVIVFIGRRKRIARYRDQQQLLSDDMMDDEDDLNIAI